MIIPNQLAGVLRTTRAMTVRADLVPAQLMSATSTGLGRARLSRLGPMVFSYKCDSGTNECECEGVQDCVDMVTSGECRGSIVCTPSSCICTWH